MELAAPSAAANIFQADALAVMVAVALIAGCTSAENDRQAAPVDTIAQHDSPDSLSDVPSEPGREAADSLAEGTNRAPWREEPLSASDVPAVYLDAWREAENRARCAVIAPDSLGLDEDAQVRRAQFAGGWGVAYDMPGLRSAFGVAGTGIADTSDTYDEWPHSRRWLDGSYAEYGPEGGGGPKQLAYLRITGQECLYNVWSQLGVDHLEFLLEHLRFVDT